MIKSYVALALFCGSSIIYGQDWKDISIPVTAGAGKVWQLQSQSDDFNYTSDATTKSADFNAKWTDFYHNAWTGPSPTIWRRDHSYVADGQLKIKASRTSGVNTNTGCITSKQRVIYPVYVETSVKIMNSVLASDVWMLSPDDTQEIDICEAYGADRWNNEWFSPKRLHLSHHVFIRTPFQDWQPNDAGSFYTNNVTVWRNDFHRIGVYWKDPWNLEYYVDGVKVRTRSGVSQIDPNNYTNGTGLSKEMDVIINTEDQTWRASQGLTPTTAELANEDNHTFKVDWIRIYKLVDSDAGFENIKNSGVQIFPNPSSSVINIKSDKSIKQLSVFALNGSVVKTVNLNGESKTIDVSTLHSGIYILKIQMADGSDFIQKLVKV